MADVVDKAERGYTPHARLLRRMARDMLALQHGEWAKNEHMQRAARLRARSMVKAARAMDRGQEAVMLMVERESGCVEAGTTTASKVE